MAPLLRLRFLQQLELGDWETVASESEVDGPCVTESASQSKSQLLLSQLEGRQVRRSSSLSPNRVRSSMLGAWNCCDLCSDGFEGVGYNVGMFEICWSSVRSWGKRTAPETTSAEVPSGNLTHTLSSDVTG